MRISYWSSDVCSSDLIMDQDQVQLVLSDRDRAALNRRASSGIVRTLAAQAIMLVLAVLVCWLVSGSEAAVSALIGAAAYFVPNALFALRLLDRKSTRLNSSH